MLKTFLSLYLFFATFQLFANEPAQYIQILNKLDAVSASKQDADLANKLVKEMELEDGVDTGWLIVNKNIALCKKLNYMPGLASATFHASEIFMQNGDVEQGFKALIDARTIYESLNDTNGIIMCYLESEVTYLSQKKFDAALAQINISYTLINKINNPYRKAQNRYLAGLCYTDLNKLDEAELCLQEAEKIYESNNYTFNLHECYTGFANLYVRKKNYEKAKDYYLKNLAYFDQEKDYTGLAVNSFGLAGILKLQNEHQEAKKHFINAFDFGEKSKILYRQDEYAKALAAIYVQEGDYKNAFHFNEIYHALHDSFYSKEKYRAIDMLETRLKMAKQDYENDLLKKQQKAKDEQIALQHNLILVVAAASLILLIISVYEFIQYRKKKKMNQELIRLNEDISKLSKEVKEKNKLLERDNIIKSFSIEEKEKRILDFAFFNAHELRAAVARILGLVNVFKHSFYNKEDLHKIVDLVETSTVELDTIVRDFGNRLVVIKEEDLKLKEGDQSNKANTE